MRRPGYGSGLEERALCPGLRPRNSDEVTVMAKMLTVDSDGHILEPLDLWERYLEPRYGDRAIRRRVNEKGYEYLEFDREPMFLPAGTMGGWGGAYMDINELMVPGKLTYWESAKRTPGAIDPGAR